MSLVKNYRIEIKNFNRTTTCNDYYLLTGYTNNINNANYIDGTPILYPIINGYTINLQIDSTITYIFLFIEHCDGRVGSITNADPKKQGGYQLVFVDLTCDDCYYPCEFGVDVIKIT
jgi:hypothetical protein